MENTAVIHLKTREEAEALAGQLTDEEYDSFLHYCRKGIDGQVDMDMVEECALESMNIKSSTPDWIIGNMYKFVGTGIPHPFGNGAAYTVCRAGAKRVLLRSSGIGHYMERSLFDTKVANGSLVLTGFNQLMRGWR